MKCCFAYFLRPLLIVLLYGNFFVLAEMVPSFGIKATCFFSPRLRYRMIEQLETQAVACERIRCVIVASDFALPVSQLRGMLETMLLALHPV